MLPGGRPASARQSHGPVDKGPERQQSRSHARQRRRGRLADRVEVHTADMAALPFPDGSFDVVTSAMAIHNIRSREERYRAVDEAMRVLRPGGRLLIADPWPMAGKYAGHLGQGTLRPLGPGYWYGGPWLGVTLVHAVKER